VNSSDSGRPNAVSRRTLIAGAAWAVPTVAVLSATPAFAASVQGPLSVNVPSLWNLNSGGVPGPIGMYLQVGNSSSAAVVFSWSLTVVKPDHTSVVWKSGSQRIGSYGTWSKDNLVYPAPNQNLPAGTYSFTLSISYDSYSASQSASLTL